MSRIVDIEPLLNDSGIDFAVNTLFGNEIERFMFKCGTQEVLNRLEALPVIDPKNLPTICRASGEVLCSVRNCPERTLKTCFKCKWHDNESMICTKRQSMVTDRPFLYTDVNYTCAGWEANDGFEEKVED